jgi:hypothetical protein
VRDVYRLCGINSNDNYGARQGDDHWPSLASNKGAPLSEAWPATLFRDSGRACLVSNLNTTPPLVSVHIIIYIYIRS